MSTLTIPTMPMVKVAKPKNSNRPKHEYSPFVQSLPEEVVRRLRAYVDSRASDLPSLKVDPADDTTDDEAFEAFLFVLAGEVLETIVPDHRLKLMLESTNDLTRGDLKKIMRPAADGGPNLFASRRVAELIHASKAAHQTRAMAAYETPALALAQRLIPDLGPAQNSLHKALTTFITMVSSWDTPWHVPPPLKDGAKVKDLPTEPPVVPTPLKAAHHRAAAAPGYVAPSRVGKKALAGYFSPEILAELKVLAAVQQRTTQSLLDEALVDLLEKHGHDVKAVRAAMRRQSPS